MKSKGGGLPGCDRLSGAAIPPVLSVFPGIFVCCSFFLYRQNPVLVVDNLNASNYSIKLTGMLLYPSLWVFSSIFFYMCVFLSCTGGRETMRKTNPRTSVRDSVAGPFSEGRFAGIKDYPGINEEQRFSKSGEQRTHPKDGSPTPKRCDTIALFGTANRRSVSELINATVGAGNNVTLRPVPLSLIFQTLSREMHTYNRALSEIFIRCNGHHGYGFTRMTLSLPGVS